MKKFLFLMLCAAVAVSASANLNGTKIKKTVVAQRGAIEQQYRTAKVVVPTAQPIKFKAPAKADVPEGYASITLEAHQVWNTDPDNPDYSGYQMLLDADATAYGVEFEAAGGSGTFAGDYANFEYKIPENADNDLETENIVYDGEVTILIPAGVYDYVIVNPTPGDRLWIAAQNGSAGGRGDDFEFRSGCAYRFLITLNSSGNDNTDVEIDDPFAPTVPLNLGVVPDVTSADVTWEDDHDAAWNLRWRPYNPNVAREYFWGFEEDADFEGWIAYDMDGDGNSWGYNDSGNYCHSGTTSVTSASYNGSALTPDNWLVSPLVPLNGTLTLWAGQRSASWPDNFGVFVHVGDVTSEEDFDNFVQVGEDAAPTTWTEFTYDLSQYEGQMGRFAIRHYNCEDQFALYIDDITLAIPGDEPAEWVPANDLDEMHYLIEGLTPDSQYEVQVQAISEDGRLSDWTESYIFTTAATVYMLGGDDQGWDCTQGTPFTYDAENDVYTLTYTFPAEYNFFGFTKVLAENNDDGGWAYIEPWRFGAIADEGTDYWYTGEEDYVSLTWDAYHAIRIAGGEYNLTVDLNEMKLYIEAVPSFIKGDVNKDGNVNVADVTALISAILAGTTAVETDHFNPAAADITGEGVTNIGDVTALIAYVLSGAGN